MIVAVGPLRCLATIRSAPRARGVALGGVLAVHQDDEVGGAGDSVTQIGLRVRHSAAIHLGRAVEIGGDDDGDLQPHSERLEGVDGFGDLAFPGAAVYVGTDVAQAVDGDQTGPLGSLTSPAVRLLLKPHESPEFA